MKCYTIQYLFLGRSLSSKHESTNQTNSIENAMHELLINVSLWSTVRTKIGCLRFWNNRYTSETKSCLMTSQTFDVRPFQNNKNNNNLSPHLVTHISATCEFLMHVI